MISIICPRHLDISTTLHFRSSFNFPSKVNVKNGMSFSKIGVNQVTNSFIFRFPAPAISIEGILRSPIFMQKVKVNNTTCTCFSQVNAIGIH